LIQIIVLMNLNKIFLMKTNFTVVTITKNEEDNVKDFINSFKNVYEIIIIDDFSEDNTKNIVEKINLKNVKFFQNKQNTNCFGSQRNLGISKASGDYIINVDCDMRGSEVFIKELDNLIAIKKPDFIKFSIINHFLNQPLNYGPWSKWVKPWIFKNGISSFTDGVHEKVILPAKTSNIFILKEKILHLGDSSYESRLKKNIRYSLDDYEKYLKFKNVSYFNLIFKPFLEFFKDYIYKRNFLNGKVGLLLSLYTSLSMFNRYLITWEKQNKKNE
jgi:glycosyltransferase involved in cell wall biosynthesis